MIRSLTLLCALTSVSFIWGCATDYHAQCGTNCDQVLYQQCTSVLFSPDSVLDPQAKKCKGTLLGMVEKGVASKKTPVEICTEYARWAQFDVPDAGRQEVEQAAAKALDEARANFVADTARCTSASLLAASKAGVGSQCEKRFYSECAVGMANRRLSQRSSKGNCKTSDIIKKKEVEAVAAFDKALAQQLEAARVDTRSCLCEKGIGSLTANISTSRTPYADMQEAIAKLSTCGKAARKKALSLDKRTAESVRQALEQALYVEQSADLKSVGKLLAKLGIQHDKNSASSLPRRLGKERTAMLAEEALEILSGNSDPVKEHGFSKPLADQMCAWAVPNLSADASYTPQQSQALDRNCQKAYRAWFVKASNGIMRSKDYKKMAEFHSAHGSQSPAAAEKAYQKSLATMESDLTKTRTSMETLLAKCDAGDYNAIAGLDRLKGFVAMDEDLAAAKLACRNKCDNTHLVNLTGECSKNCRPAQTKLSTHLYKTRGNKISSPVMKLTTDPNIEMDDYAARLKEALADTYTETLAAQCISTHACFRSQAIANQAQSAIKAKDPVQAMLLLDKAEKEFHMDRNFELVEEASKLMSSGIIAEGNKALDAKLYGKAWLLTIVYDKLISDSSAEWSAIREKAEAALWSTVAENRVFEATRLNRSGQAASQYSPEKIKEDVAGTPVSDENVKQMGMLVKVGVRKLGAGWTYERSRSDRTHHYQEANQVPNEEKLNACRNLPAARSELQLAETAMRAAKQACDRAANAVGSELGWLGKLATSTACDMASSELIYNRSAEKVATFEQLCNYAPDLVTKIVDKSYDYSVDIHSWQFYADLGFYVADAQGNEVCSIDRRSDSSVVDENHPGNTSAQLPPDPLVKPETDGMVASNYTTAVAKAREDIDRCVKMEAGKFLKAMLNTTATAASEDDKNVDIEVRQFVFSNGRMPQYEQLQVSANKVVPVEMIQETLRKCRSSRGQ